MRLLVALLLLAGPAWAGDYWVAPYGSNVKTGAFDGSDSTAAHALSLAWANTYTMPDDVVRAASGNYGIAIAPYHSGTAGHPITFIGDIAQPYSRRVTRIVLDSLNSSGNNIVHAYISVKGFGVDQDVSIKYGASKIGPTVAFVPRVALAVYDSISYCTVTHGASIQTCSHATIAHCTIGSGTPTNPDNKDKFGVNDNGNKWVWSEGVVVTDNVMTLSTYSFAVAMNWSWAKSGVYARNRVTSFVVAGAGDAHLNTWYDVQDMDIYDNSWLAASFGTYDAYYGLNVRDNQVANRWVRDTVLQADNSAKPIKALLMTSGTEPNTDHNNRWDSCYFKVGGETGYQNNSTGDVVLFNTIITGAKFFVKGTDSLTLTHNTIVSFGLDASAGRYNAYVLDGDVACTRLRATKNIFYQRDSTHCGGHITYSGTSFNTTPGVSDSNLFWCQQPADSTSAVNFTGCAGGSLRGSWCSTYSLDCASHWADPLFTDSTWATFNAKPVVLSIALSTNLWGAENYVGSTTAGGTAIIDLTPPVVSILQPDNTSLQTETDPIYIEWASTDNIGVTSVDIDYKRYRQVVWSTVAHGLGVSSNYLWAHGDFRESFVYVRIRAYDLAGNVGETILKVEMECDACADRGGRPRTSTE